MMTKTRDQYRFFHSLRVRWAEVDMQKIVFNGHYLMYFDTAIADYWRALALPYDEVLTRFGGDMFVKKATLEYHASAKFDDRLEVGVRCQRIGVSSLTFDMAIFNQNELLVTGELVYVFAGSDSNTASQKSQPVPAELRDLFEAYERGESMVKLKIGNWASMGKDAGKLRVDVFVTEQRIPIELEWDGRDEASDHAVAYNRYGLALATGRLLPDGHIGRMAVAKAVRGTHAGVLVLEGLVALAKEKGHQQAILSAQTYAQGFYAKRGFVAQGAVYDDAGIPHVDMVRELK